jgi:hypothetical protein
MVGGAARANGASITVNKTHDTGVEEDARCIRLFSTLMLDVFGVRKLLALSPTTENQCTNVAAPYCVVLARTLVAVVSILSERVYVIIL